MDGLYRNPIVPVLNITAVLLPRPVPSAIFRAMSEGGVLFSSETEVYFGINAVGAIIWELLPTCATVDELCQTLAQRFTDVGIDRIRHDVEAFLTDLRANGLVVDASVNAASGGAAISSAS